MIRGIGKLAAKYKNKNPKSPTENSVRADLGFLQGENA
jgi:hypothetical protein